MIRGLKTAWLYAYSPSAAQQQRTFHTVFVSGGSQPASAGQRVIATIALSYLAAVAKEGAGARIGSYTPPFGPAVIFNDFKYNTVYLPQCIAVSFELVAQAAEAYAVGTVYVL